MKNKHHYSNGKVLGQANKAFMILERDARKGNNYAIGILKEIFEEKVGQSATRPNKADQTDTRKYITAGLDSNAPR